MKLTKLLDNLYKLEADNGLFLKEKKSNHVFENEIYFGKEEFANDYEEVDGVTKNELKEKECEENGKE